MTTHPVLRDVIGVPKREGWACLDEYIIKTEREHARILL